VGTLAVELLEQAIREELSAAGPDVVAANLARVEPTWRALADRAGTVVEGPDEAPPTGAVDWVDLPFDPAARSAPTIHATANSVEVRTGLWRTVRPVIDLGRCHRCSWICSTLCPDSAIVVADDRTPSIDYDHCKGCGICAAVCPAHAIDLVAESEAAGAAEGRP
jgi:pyruvate ferredoxin oxidoreductase gamma subunit